MKIEMIEKTFKTKRSKWLKESSKQIQSENEELVVLETVKQWEGPTLMTLRSSHMYNKVKDLIAKHKLCCFIGYFLYTDVNT